MERSEALALGLTKYNTGRACRNGHYADRYTDSGSCQECVNGKPSVRVVLSPEYAAQAAQLVEVKLRAYASDLPVLRDTVIGMTQVRFPLLGAASFMPSTKPTSAEAGTALYRFMVHAEEIEFFREVALSLRSMHTVDFSHLPTHRRMREAERLRGAPVDWALGGYKVPGEDD
jgi:hypothetical protein